MYKSIKLKLLYEKLYLKLVGVSVMAATLAGCSMDRMMPMAMMPTPPSECEKVLGFKVEPLPKGKTTDAQLAVWMAKEGATRQTEHSTSRVCAEYALRVAGVMKDKEVPAAAKQGVEPAKVVPPTKAKKASKPAAVPEANDTTPAS
jgi:hypothetical protein